MTTSDRIVREKPGASELAAKIAEAAETGDELSAVKAAYLAVLKAADPILGTEEQIKAAHEVIKASAGEAWARLSDREIAEAVRGGLISADEGQRLKRVRETLGIERGADRSRED